MFVCLLACLLARSIVWWGFWFMAAFWVTFNRRLNIHPWPIIFVVLSLSCFSLCVCVCCRFPFQLEISSSATTISIENLTKRNKKQKQNVVGWNCLSYFMCFYYISIGQCESVCVCVRAHSIRNTAICDCCRCCHSYDRFQPTTVCQKRKKEKKAKYACNDEYFEWQYKCIVTNTLNADDADNEMRLSESGLQCNKMTVHSIYIAHARTHAQ